MNYHLGLDTNRTVRASLVFYGRYQKYNLSCTAHACAKAESNSISCVYASKLKSSYQLIAAL